MACDTDFDAAEGGLAVIQVRMAGLLSLFEGEPRRAAPGWGRGWEGLQDGLTVSWAGAPGTVEEASLTAVNTRTVGRHPDGRELDYHSWIEPPAEGWFARRPPAEGLWGLNDSCAEGSENLYGDGVVPVIKA